MNTISGRLGDFITLQRGYDLPARERLDGDIPIVSSSGITGWHSEAKVDGPGVITGRYGTLGEVFFVDKPFWPLNTSLYVKDFKGNYPRYVSYLLSYVLRGEKGTAGAVPGVNRNILHERPVIMPDRKGQEIVANILSSYDDLIKSNKQRIQLLEQSIKLLYKEWFVHFRFPGHEHLKIVNKLPAGWEELKLNNIMSFEGGSQPPKNQWVTEYQDGYVRMIQIRDYQTNNHVAFVRENKKLRKCEPFDIMIARYGASLGRICYGLSGAYNVALVKVLPKEPNIREFLRIFLNEDAFQTLLLGMSGRSAQAGFNKAVLSGITLKIPKNRKLLCEFEEIVVSSIQLRLNILNQIEMAQKAKDLLLAPLINGEIEL